MNRRFLFLFKMLCIAALVFITNLFFTKEKQTFTIVQVEAAKDKGILFLTLIQREDGAICDTMNPLFETWETILALSAIRSSNADTNAPVLKRGLAFLSAQENADGLICHNQKCRAAYCLETTAVYLDLLNATGRKDKMIAGSKKIAKLQKQSGEWEIGNPDVKIRKDFPSVTAFVLNSMQTAGAEAAFKKEAMNWLLQRQNPAGHWGTAWEYYGCPAYCLWPMMKLFQHENTIASRSAKEKALQYIISSQQKDGSWSYSDPALQKQVSPELQTVLMLSALQSAGAGNEESVLKGIRFLLSSQQTNGSWDGGYFPIPEKRYSKREYVFATALAAEVMQNYLSNNSR